MVQSEGPDSTPPMSLTFVATLVLVTLPAAFLAVVTDWRPVAWARKMLAFFALPSGG